MKGPRIKAKKARTKPKDTLVTPFWQGSGTQANYAKLGLAHDPNADINKLNRTISGLKELEPKFKPSAEKDKLMPILDAIDTQGNLTGVATSSKPPYYMSEEEINYIERCMKKHGKNFKKMFMDIVSYYLYQGSYSFHINIIFDLVEREHTTIHIEKT